MKIALVAFAALAFKNSRGAHAAAASPPSSSNWTSVVTEHSKFALPRYGETVKGLQVEEGDETCLYQFGGAPYNDVVVRRLCPSTASVKGWQAVAAPKGSAIPAASDPGHPSLMWIHGGQDRAGGKLADLWRFDASDNSWELVSNATGPPALIDHTMDYGSGELVLFGGEADDGLISSVVWAMDVSGAHGYLNQWRKVLPSGPKIPEGRTAHASAVYYGQGGEGFLLVHGGKAADGKLLGDVWRLSLIGDGR